MGVTKHSLLARHDLEAVTATALTYVRYVFGINERDPTALPGCSVRDLAVMIAYEAGFASSMRLFILVGAVRTVVTQPTYERWSLITSAEVADPTVRSIASYGALGLG